MENKKLSLHSKPHRLILLIMSLVLAPLLSFCQEDSAITSPEKNFGQMVGTDYTLFNYSEFVDYWTKLAEESERMRLVDIGKTSEGRTIWMAVITSPANHKKLDRYKHISKKLASAENLTDEEAQELTEEGRAVVWIDAGLHATEIANAQALLEITYRMVSGTGRENLRILDDVILLAACSNPDGLDLVADWYMRKKDPLRRSYKDIPRLYHKYAGHNNNRDSYMVNLLETENINHVLYQDWLPQIVYTMHQRGPAGTVLYCPPYNDPHNYNLDPLAVLETDLVGTAMHVRFAAEGKPGVCRRSEGPFSMWRNGSYRITPYFHNMIGINTEINGDPTPMEIPFIPFRQLPRTSNINPVEPQKWHFRQCIEYLNTAVRAVLDCASKHREDFLFNIYRMGRSSIERGNRNHWTITPKRIEAVTAAMNSTRGGQLDPRGRSLRSSLENTYAMPGSPAGYFHDILRDPAFVDARGYILPSDQPDFLTATKFVNSLIKGGVTVLKADKPFDAGGRAFPVGSYVIKTAQAFRPHILDMFEPHDFPCNVTGPGKAPFLHYGTTGYTLAYQMGVEFTRILEGFDGPFHKIEGLARPDGGEVKKPDATGFLLSHRMNDSFTAVNRLLAADEDVYWLKKPIRIEGRTIPEGSMYIPSKEGTVKKLREMAVRIGLDFEGIDTRPECEAFHLKPVFIGLWDQYGGSMASGWVRWLLERNGFDFELIFPKQIDEGNLKEKFDVLIFVGSAFSERNRRTPPLPSPDSIPEKWRDRLGRLSIVNSVPRLREFLNDGGTILTIGKASCLGYHLGLSVSNALVDETGKSLTRNKFYAPGSIHQVQVDTSHPLAYGLPGKLDVVFENSPVFKVKERANIKKVAWYGLDDPLRSGALRGSQYLKGGTVVIDADMGRGKLFLIGPEIINRAQAHGTFKLLFNGIYYGRAKPEKL